MGRMSLWQIMKYRQGYVASKTVQTEEEKAKADLQAISDDDFFAAMDVEINEGEAISEEEFIVAMKKEA